MTHHLTPTERRIVHLLLAGHLTNIDIAAVRGCRAQTVKNHFTSIFAKTGHCCKPGLILWALHNGWELPPLAETATKAARIEEFY